MLNKFKEKYIFIYVICVALLFKVTQKLSGFVQNLFLNSSLMPSDSTAKVFSIMIIANLIVTIVMLLVLWATNRLSLLKKKGTGFFKGISIGIYQLIYSTIILFFMCFAAIKEGMSINNIGNIIIFLVCMFLVGLAEELSCRALITESLLEHFGTSKKGVWKAAIISGVIFGLMHLFNFEMQFPLSTIIQAIMAGISGIMLAAIYFRCGNIWTLVFLHAFNDIAAAGAFGFFSGTDLLETVQSKTDGKAFMVLIMAIPTLIVTFYLLRDKKLNELQKTWPEIKK